MARVYDAGIGFDSYPVPDPQRLSLAERDRRWAKMRALMAHEAITILSAITAERSRPYLRHDQPLKAMSIKGDQ
jgi:hypothetical protein